MKNVNKSLFYVWPICLLQPPIPIFYFLQETVKTVFCVQTCFIRSVNGLEWLGYEI